MQSILGVFHVIIARQQLRLELAEDLTALNIQNRFFTYVSDALVPFGLSLSPHQPHTPHPVIFHPPGLLHTTPGLLIELWSYMAAGFQEAGSQSCQAS